MAPKPTNWRMYGKMATIFLACSIGGPALVYYVSPTEEELFKKYSPDLQRKSLENRIGKQQAFDDYVVQLKEYSKSNKSIWEAHAEAGRKVQAESERKAEAEAERRAQAQAERIAEREAELKAKESKNNKRSSWWG